ncbi:hypothetical protein [Acinetobacter sp. SFA]|uniref:hypothetical protein n=1 Tax=Acinetobacter sp. SFA TaxID=1805633 RepID=UPI0007D04BBA|nr:hypothetical protein [Acinetobacter sp. SFA]OAL80696.1 hypothetical protein AY607_03115 [Acinetobacter sp. SFA]
MAGILNATWVGAHRYTFPYSGVNARWGASAQHIDVQPIQASGMGSVSTLRNGMVYPSGFNGLEFSRVPTISKPNQYVQASCFLDATWQGAVSYAGSFTVVSGGWSDVTYLYPAGIHEDLVGEHELRLGQQFITADGFDALLPGDGYALHYWEYAYPEWVLDASWVGKTAYSSYEGMLDGVWRKPSVNSYIAVIGVNEATFGSARLSNGYEYLAPLGFNADIFGQASLNNNARLIRPGGINPGAVPLPKIEGLINILKPASFVSEIFGKPVIYNLRQYLLSRPYDAQLFGKAFMGGGVKTVTVSGFSAPTIPGPKVVNTRANQTVNLHSPSRGIAPIAPPEPNVSPQILYPKGVLAWSFGTPWVQRNPSPKGFVTDSYGTAWVSHSPRYLKPDFVKAFESGYAKVFDPTQKVGVSGVNTVIAGGIFGDIAIRNKRRFIQVTGSDQSDYGNWSSIFSNLIVVHAQSFDHALFGNNVIFNKTPSLIPKSWNSADFGLALVSERIRRINARGFGITEIDRFGRHVLTKPPELFPRTFLSQVFGQTTISNRRRFIFAGALDSLVFKSDITVWFRYRHLNPVGIKEIEPSKPKIEHGLRTLLQKGSDLSRVATPTVWFKVRSVLATSIYREFETNHIVGGTQFINPAGYIASLFGTRIVPENQGLYGTGFNAQGFTEKHKIELHTRWVRATGFLTFGIQTSDRYGTASIWNKRQYIRHNYDSGDGLNPGDFGQWTTIANRNREIKAIGYDASRQGYTQTDNKARPLSTKGINHTAIGNAMIADRVRHLNPEGMEVPYLSGWGRVYNAAAQILVSGDKHEYLGRPSVVNTRREYRWVGAFESMLFGVPMIAFRIRKLSIESRYSIAPIYMPLPKVDLYTRYIDPPGPDLSAFGGPSLHIKWNTFTPRWTHRELFGDPIVRNVTPELRHRGNNSEVIGLASVRTQWRHLPVEGYGAELLGRVNIAYRNRSISISGFNAFKFGLHKAVRTGAPPYSLQTITLDWAGEGQRPDAFEGDGIKIPEYQVTRPNVKSNVIFAEGYVATLFGSHHIQSNGILVHPGIQEFSIGDHTIGLKNRVIEVPTMGDLLQFEKVMPRLSPHTIYAVNNAPPQAIKNHPVNRAINYINDNGILAPPGEIFGRVRITLQHRKLTVTAGNELSIGRPSVILRKHYILPNGFLSFRMGWHVLLDGSPQFVEQYDSENQALYGRPVVTSIYYGPQYLTGRGFNSNTFGTQRVEFFHRSIRPQGYLATLMGARKSGDTAYKPQGLWVGRPMPTIPDGFNAEVFGDTTISLRVRDVTVEGFDSFISEMDISNFKGRMKVTLVKKPVVIEPKEIKAEAFGITAYGVPNIRLKTHYIRPDGNSDQYRKGGPK